MKLTNMRPKLYFLEIDKDKSIRSLGESQGKKKNSNLITTKYIEQ